MLVQNIHWRLAKTGICKHTWGGRLGVGWGLSWRHLEGPVPSPGSIWAQPCPLSLSHSGDGCRGPKPLISTPYLKKTAPFCRPQELEEDPSQVSPGSTHCMSSAHSWTHLWGDPWLSRARPWSWGWASFSWEVGCSGGEVGALKNLVFFRKKGIHAGGQAKQCPLHFPLWPQHLGRCLA